MAAGGAPLDSAKIVSFDKKAAREAFDYFFWATPPAI
jgi:hypothetical protein